MNNINLVEKASEMKTVAICSKDNKHRYCIRMIWDEEKPKCAIIMSQPSSAGELLLDQTTMLCRNNAVKNKFGSLSILNLFSQLNSENFAKDKLNLSVILEECKKADIVLVAFGRSESHKEEKQQLLELLKVYEDKLYSIVEKPYSHPLSPACREWAISKLKCQ